MKRRAMKAGALGAQEQAKLNTMNQAAEICSTGTRPYISLSGPCKRGAKTYASTDMTKSALSCDSFDERDRPRTEYRRQQTDKRTAITDTEVIRDLVLRSGDIRR